MVAPTASRRSADEALVPEAEPSDGVDISLVRWTLSLTPAERLDVLQAFVDSVFELRGAVRRAQVPRRFDLDIVPARESANIDALLAALAELDARYRDPGGCVIRPEATALTGPGHQLLTTTAGPLDVLGAIVGDRAYDDLATHCDYLELDGTSIAVLNLATLIEIKA